MAVMNDDSSGVLKVKLDFRFDDFLDELDEASTPPPGVLPDGLLPVSACALKVELRCMKNASTSRSDSSTSQTPEPFTPLRERERERDEAWATWRSFSILIFF